MSRLTAYVEWTKTVLESYRGERSSQVEPLKLQEEPIKLPLYGSKEIDKVRDFYRKQLEVADRFALSPTRKKYYRKFYKTAIEAHIALYRKQPCEEGVECLVASLKHINTALKWAMRLRDYDDQHPIGLSEWGTSQFGPVENDQNARKTWFHFKLASIRPCLLLAVQVLKLTLPDPSYRDLFKESEMSLLRGDWHSQFIYDSHNSRKKTMLQHPQLSDVLALLEDYNISGC